ncbi:MAG: class I SAM-dependent RNA methyltransferase [Oscillospiraceae bacterium]|nr:class I SAM-dependent RNA methyltransferase [Oscillospiraceae bacterium]
MGVVTLTATTAFGTESALAYELDRLGYRDRETETGRITYRCDEAGIARSNVMLRCADRVLLRMGAFKAESFDELYDGVSAIGWEGLMPRDATFPVEAKSVSSRLFSVSDCQAIAKKAIAERLKKAYKAAWIEEVGAVYRTILFIHKDIVSVGVDTSGEGLHKRGYRILAHGAPIRETLAAAILLITRWRPGIPLIDPFCGSGTIPIEAAMMAFGMAPGAGREFASMGWGMPGKAAWGDALAEAGSAAAKVERVGIIGTDIDRGSISASRHHAARAGVGGAIHFQEMDVGRTSSPAKNGYTVTNPPYGERTAHDLPKTYRAMAEAYGRLETWSHHVITAYEGMERIFGRKADKRRKLYNGGIECQLYQYLSGPAGRPRADGGRGA